jgi:hypothetical protein
MPSLRPAGRHGVLDIRPRWPSSRPIRDLVASPRSVAAGMSEAAFELSGTVYAFDAKVARRTGRENLHPEVSGN